MRQILSLLLAFIALLPCHCATPRAEVENALSRQMELYPRSTLQDIYKNMFQGEFGPGHIIANRESAERYIRSELEMVHSIPTLLWEPVGVEGNFVRVDLGAVKAGLITVDQLLDALIDSANCAPAISIDQWKETWSEILAVVRELYPDLPDLATTAEEIDCQLAAGNYVMHHSRLFNELYHPHYRLIQTAIFTDRLLPLINAGNQ